MYFNKVAGSFPKIHKNEVMLSYFLTFYAIFKFQLFVKFPEHR